MGRKDFGEGVGSGKPLLSLERRVYCHLEKERCRLYGGKH